MNIETEEYIKFLVEQIKNFQKDENKLNKNDYEAIEKVISSAISYNDETNKAINIPLAFLIGNSVLQANIGKKKVENELNNPDNTQKKQRLKNLKKSINVKKVIKSSPFLTKVNKAGNIIDEYLIENIPAIDCIISKEGLVARGYTQTGMEIIYEIYKEDQNPSMKNVDLLSTKQIIETPETYFGKK